VPEFVSMDFVSMDLRELRAGWRLREFVRKMAVLAIISELDDID